MWNLPGPGLEPVSPALADRFLTTGPPGKSQMKIYNEQAEKKALERKKYHQEPGSLCWSLSLIFDQFIQQMLLKGFLCIQDQLMLGG